MKQLIQTIQLIQVIQNSLNTSLSRRGKGGVEWLGGPLWSPAVDLLKMMARHLQVQYIVGATLAVALGWLGGPLWSPSLPLNIESSSRTAIDLSRRGEGGVEWLGGPLWSPAVPLNNELPSQIAIDKGVKYANNH